MFVLTGFAKHWKLNLAMGSRFAVTRNGYFGIMPPLSCLGDEIYIHPRCRVPVAFRPSKRLSSQPQELSLFRSHVGACYMLGLMAGEPGCKDQYFQEWRIGRKKKIVLVEGVYICLKRIT